MEAKMKKLQKFRSKLEEIFEIDKEVRNYCGA